MDVTLIVKASNQQCEDLTIKCEPSWTIRRLKGHLTEVYPGKPSTDEQKLIYSGQLLSDSVVLKDVLRQYDGQQAHTVHLVFTPKNSYYGGSSSSSGSKSNNTNSKMVSNASTSSSAATNTASSANSNAASISSDGTSAASYARNARDGVSQMEETVVDGAGGDGLRQRSVTQARSTAARMNPPRTSQFAEQTAAYQSFMQQTYTQYLNRYVNLINGQNNANALYSASGLPGAAGTAETTVPTTINPLTGSQPFPAVPFVPVIPPTTMAGGFPNLAYYPCMTPAPYFPSGFPSATNIPTAPSAAVNAGNVPAGVLSSSTLPSSSSGPPTSSSMVAGDTSATTPSATPSETGTETATAAAAATEQGAPQDGAPGAGAGAAAAGAPARARRFPNIVVEEQENNDWLDVFFSMCRVGILITVIYLYSSPMRCLTVLFIGVMLYLKKHLDRVYQAIDRRIPRLQPNQDANAAAAAPREQQPVAAVQPNNNVPDRNPTEQPQRPHAADVGASGVENVSKTTRSSETENTTVGAGTSGSQGSSSDSTSSSSNEASTSSRTIMPRPRTGSIGRNAETTENAVLDGEQQQQQQAERMTEGDTATAEEPAAEGQRMTFNDMTSFLGTLVITFFTSIIPDTPAA
ncbi:uncharacterized protein LOC126564317 [Anopheles maculipalpis]|uniref:uncharacterized protein LOC126564317 n=1 Tax=Anopheles maculipalpis TaxID=1496333 RepID=UPI002159412C|nr:uncharacterized protein LOC126564317 [Anopheles maculipalpis]